MPYYVHFATDRNEPYPPLAALRLFEGDTPTDALKPALNAMPPPVENDGEQFWARVMIETENGAAKRALSVLVVREGVVPIDFGLPGGGGSYLAIAFLPARGLHYGLSTGFCASRDRSPVRPHQLTGFFVGRAGAGAGRMQG